MEQAIHMTHNRLVAGSSPAGATKYQGLTLIRRPLVFSRIPIGYFRRVLAGTKKAARDL